MRHRIYVPLLDDPAALGESDAVPAGHGQFRLVGTPPQQERLLFKRGEIVECEIRTLPGGSKDLVAIRSVSAEPEFKKRQHVFAIFGAGAGAVAFAFCSIRWGDAAWDVLARAFNWRKE